MSTAVLVAAGGGTRLGALLGGAALAALVPRCAVAAVTQHGLASAAADAASIATLYTYLLCAPVLWGRHGRRYARPLSQYGFSCRDCGKARAGGEALVGFAAGAAMTLAIVAAPAPAAVSAALASAGPMSLAAAAPPLVAGGVALAAVEELLFRGFLADEASREFGERLGTVAVAAVFAVAHLSPRAAFGLAMLSLALSGLKRRCGGRLWAPVGLHAGLVSAYASLASAGA
eukprot:PRCOL_00005095-RA